jgi:hypothetical protein
VAKDVNEGNETQCLGEGHRMPERLGAVGAATDKSRSAVRAVGFSACRKVGNGCGSTMPPGRAKRPSAAKMGAIQKAGEINRHCGDGRPSKCSRRAMPFGRCRGEHTALTRARGS